MIPHLAHAGTGRDRQANFFNGINRGIEALKNRDSTKYHVIFEPLDFIARLAQLVQKPRVKNLTRFDGVFAPNSKPRALVTPAKRGRSNQASGTDEPPTPTERRASLTLAQRLKRVFNIDIETCSVCGGCMKAIASIEDPVVIKQILDHLVHKAQASEPRALPESRAVRVV